jgi:hypothetical protein
MFKINFSKTDPGILKGTGLHQPRFFYCNFFAGGLGKLKFLRNDLINKISFPWI